MKTVAILSLGLGLIHTVAAACPTFQVFVARGTLESPGGSGASANGQGLIGLASADIVAEIPGSNTTGVPYPATFDYVPSEQQGVGNLTKILVDFYSTCPTTYIALLGYSQGAQVVSDTLCGSNEANFPSTVGIDFKYTKNVIAIAGLADPANTVGLVGVTKFGNSTRSGIFPRTSLGVCASYAGRFGTWCTDDDNVCDSGTSLSKHIQEVGLYRDEIVRWVVGHYYAAIGQPAPYPTQISSTIGNSPTSKSSAPTTTSKATTTSLQITTTATTKLTTTAPYLNSTLHTVTTRAPHYPRERLPSDLSIAAG